MNTETYCAFTAHTITTCLFNALKRRVMKKIMVGAILCIAALSTTFAQEKKCCSKKVKQATKTVCVGLDSLDNDCDGMTAEMEEKKKKGKEKGKKFEVRVNRIEMARVAVGGKLTGKRFKEIPPSKIASKRVLSPKEAMKKYGKEGKHGVVEITLKK